MNIRKTTKGKDRNFLTDINGFEGIYKIDSKGNIYSFHKNKLGKLRKQVLNSNGYFCVKLYKEKKYKMIDVHRIIAQTFIENKNNYNQVDHIDGNKQNNSLENLRWVDNRLNQIYRFQKVKKSSKYYGVTWHKLKNKWQSSIKISGKQIYLGLFKEEIDAHNAYKNYLANLQ